MAFITSTQLHGSATVPHCLDNQYLPTESLAEYLQSANGWEAARQVGAERQSAVRREFIRALLYSPQVIVNRAFALNETFFHSILADDAECRALDRLCVGETVTATPLVILLFKSRRKSTGKEGKPRQEEGILDILDDPPGFDISPEGERLWRRFFEATTRGKDNLTYLRLTEGEVTQISERFRTTLFSLAVIPETVSRMFDQCTYRQQETNGRVEAVPHFKEEFFRFLDDVFMPWAAKTGTGLSRQAYYDRFVLPKNQSGQFSETGLRRETGDEPFPFELKLMADLVYNHNTPFTLRRHSFIPSGLPDPRCLPPSTFQPSAVGSAEQLARMRGAIHNVLDAQIDATNDFRYFFQAECLLPDFATFKISDVLEIRKWDEWRNYRKAQEALVNAVGFEPFRAALEDVANSIDAFHRRLYRESDHFAHWRRVALKPVKVAVQVLVKAGVDYILPESAGSISNEIAKNVVEGGLDVVINFIDQRIDGRYQSSSVQLNLQRYVECNDATKAKLQELERQYADHAERVATPREFKPAADSTKDV